MVVFVGNVAVLAGYGFLKGFAERRGRRALPGGGGAVMVEKLKG